MQTLMMQVFYGRVKETLNIKEELLAKLDNKAINRSLWNAIKQGCKVDLSRIKMLSSGKKNYGYLNAESTKVGVLATENEDIRSLRELITYGLKGLSAYMKHANALGYEDEDIYAFMQKALAKTTR